MRLTVYDINPTGWSPVPKFPTRREANVFCGHCHMRIEPNSTRVCCKDPDSGFIFVVHPVCFVSSLYLPSIPGKA